MPVRQIQNRISIQLGLAAAGAVVFLLALFVWLAREEHAEAFEQEASLLLHLALEAGGKPEPLKELAGLEANIGSWSGRPALFVWGDGNVPPALGDLPSRISEQLLLPPNAGLRYGGFSYWVESRSNAVSGNRIHAMVRMSTPGILSFAAERYGLIALGGFLFILGFGVYTFRLHGVLIYRPLSNLVNQIEARIEGLSGEGVSKGSEGDEIQRLSRRYHELVEVVDSQRAAFKNQRSELRSLLDSLPAYVWYKDDKNNIVRVNKSGAESVGYAVEELEGKSVAEFFPEEADAYYRDDREVIDSGLPKLGYVETYTPIKGKARTIRTDKIPYFDSTGKVIGVVALLSDITELVELQEERLSSERLMRRLVEIGNWEAGDVDERIAAALKDTCETLGLKTGIFSEIEGETYTIRQVYDERGHSSVGDSFLLEEVYCSFVVIIGRSFATHHMGTTKWAELACYEKVRLESYIASPIRIGGKIIGTINFSAPDPRSKPFSQIEIDAVRLIARWIEGLIRREAILEQLNRQKAELRLILDTTPNHIWFTDDQGRILRANQSAARSVGKTVEEVEGKEVQDVFSEGGQRQHTDDLAVLEEGEPRLGIVRSVLLEGGTDQWTRTDVLPYELEGGRRGIITVASDITELVESQRALKAAEEKFRMAVEASPTGMLIIDPELRITLLNNEAERIFGYDREELEWTSVERLLGKRISVALRDIFDTEPTAAKNIVLGANGELFANRKDALKMPVEVILSPYRLSSDRFVMASVFDISSRIDSRKALQDSEERFQLAAKGASVGIWDWFDIDGEGLWWSPKFYDLVGYRSDEIEAKLATFDSLLHPDDKEATFDAINRCLREGSAFLGDYRLRCKSGEYRWFLGSGMVSVDAEGLVRRMTGTIQDIHDRKVAEEELSKVVSDLKLANEELSNFAFLSSHDLQEPLRTISSFLKLLKDVYGEQLDKDANEYMDYTLVAVYRMQNMIRSLLNYSRLDSREIVQKSFRLDEAVEMAEMDLRKRFEETGVHFEKPDGLPMAFGDLNQVSLVFQNLFSNALKFNQSDPPRITLDCYVASSEALDREGLAPGEYSVVTVADNGIGIRDKYQKRIFAIFQKLHPAGEYEGSGIGLSMVQKIMQKHSGQVWLESEEGRGTCFYLAFPTMLKD